MRNEAKDEDVNVRVPPRPFQYALPGTHNRDGYDLWSMDRQLNDPADDFGNWREQRPAGPTTRRGEHQRRQ